MLRRNRAKIGNHSISATQTFNTETSHGFLSNLNISVSKLPRGHSNDGVAERLPAAMMAAFRGCNGGGRTKKIVTADPIHDESSKRPCKIRTPGVSQLKPGMYSRNQMISEHTGFQMRKLWGSYFTRPFRRSFRGLGLSRRCSSSTEHNHGPREGATQKNHPITGKILELEALTWINLTGGSRPSG
jgi:hypothetical protein